MDHEQAGIKAREIDMMLARKYDGRTDHANKSALYEDLVKILIEAQLPTSFEVDGHSYDVETKTHFLLLSNGDRLRLPEPVVEDLFARGREQLAGQVEMLKAKILKYETMGAVEAVARPLIRALQAVQIAGDHRAEQIAREALYSLQEPLSELGQEPQEQPDIDKLREIRDDLARQVVDLRRLALQGTPTADLYATAAAAMGLLLAHISALCAEAIV